MTALLLSLVAVTAKGMADRPTILDGAADAYASEFVFFATDYGIYTFDRNSGTWGRITTASGLPSNRTLALGLDEGVLWVATESGLASADVRINDWQAYDLPGQTRALAFDDKYAWAGGDSGLRRFDKYAETWSIRSEVPVNDLLADKGLLWIAGATGVFCYDPKFDRIDDMPAPPDTYDHIINTPSRVWFAGRRTLVAYNKAAGSWADYGPLAIDDFATFSDSVFVASHGRGFRYDPRADLWAEIHEAEVIPPIGGIFATGDAMLLATDLGLIIYDYKENTRKIWNQKNGLTANTLVRVYADAHHIYVVSARDIQVQDQQKGTWSHEDLVVPGAKREELVYLDDAGAHLRLVPDTDVRLAGRAYYSATNYLPDDLDSIARFPNPLPCPLHYALDAWYLARLRPLENVNLNLAAKHKTGRTLSLFYDDSDEDQVAYGLGYRGVGNDLLHRANAGKLKSEYREFDLIPQFSVLGANARLQRGDRGVDLQAGRIESALRSEFFTGRSVDKEVTLLDVNYAKGSFYRIRRPVTPQWDTVFVDDRDPATDTFGTRSDFTVGGITGDFDPLVRGTDYFLDRQGGIIRLLGARNPGDALVLVTDAGAQVLQSESVTGNALKNIYSFGTDITPGSFDLEITDTAGTVHALSEFGIDADRDGRVDPAFINHDLGFLSFPSPLVPDSFAASHYSLHARFRSQSTFYSITYRPIVKNSETVLVDGAPMTRGTDYVMDYTSGTLLFLKKDAVTDFSQIDVRYSSVDVPKRWAAKDLLVSGQPTMDIGRNVVLAPGFTRVADENIVHISGRAEAGTGTANNVRFVPQVAYNTNKALAQDYSLSGNYRILSAAVQYRGFGSGFNEFGAGDRRYGLLRHSAAASVGVEPFSQFRLDGSAKREYVADTLSANSSLLTANYVSGRLSYLNPKYPNGFVLVANDRLPDGNKLRVKVNGGYEFTLLKSKLKLIGIAQNNTLDHLTTGPLDRSLEYITEATFVLPFAVQGSIRYRNNGLSSDGEKTRREDELRGQLNVDVVPGFFYTGSYNLLSEASPLGSSQDLAIESYFYNNLQIAPGRWWSRLSLVNFSVGTGSNFDEYVRNLDSAYARPFLLLSPLSSLPGSAVISSAHDLRTLYGTVQLQPLSGLTLRAKHTVGNSGTAYYGPPELKPSTEDELRAEYEREHLGMFSALFSSRAASGLPRTTRRNLYFEWNMPWSALLRTRLTATYGFDEEYYGPTLTLHPQSVAPNVEALFQFNARSYATAGFGVACERRTFSATGSGWVPDPWKISLRPAAGFNLNLLKFLYVQLSYQSAFVLAGTPSHVLSARLTTQF